jgi:hypothetical protein
VRDLNKLYAPECAWLCVMDRSAVLRLSCAQSDPAVVDAMALLARETGFVVHVIAPRRPGFIQHAREAGELHRLQVEADARPNTVRVRFWA